jgi:hypothetical protein
MLTDDGILVTEVGFWGRVREMYLVAYCMRDPEIKALTNPSWRKFLGVAFQYILLGRYRVFTKEEMKGLNP